MKIKFELEEPLARAALAILARAYPWVLLQDEAEAIRQLIGQFNQQKA